MGPRLIKKVTTVEEYIDEDDMRGCEFERPTRSRRKELEGVADEEDFELERADEFEDNETEE